MSEPKCHFFLHGKHQDPLFNKYRVAIQHIAEGRPHVQVTIEAEFETQYEEKLKYLIREYGGSFSQSTVVFPLIFAEFDDNKVLYFLNEQRFFDWASQRFKYTDSTRRYLYKRIGNVRLRTLKETSGCSYCMLCFVLEDDLREKVELELFDEDCPVLSKNFFDLLSSPNFDSHPVHRVKAGAFIQAGDLVDGSGLNSVAHSGVSLRHESFQVKHDRGGLLGMANHGKDTNGSQFYITLRELPFLDGKSAIFGRVISGMRTIRRISKVATVNERPTNDILVYFDREHSRASTTLHERGSFPP